ncbi:hypothetical protein BH09DEP1_BH09DEP1_4290 [soil metagenome]
MTKTLIKIAAVLVLLSFGASVFYYYAPQPVFAAASPISDFQDERDTQDVLNLFEKDRYWLISSEDYDPSYALKTRSPNKRDNRYFGKLNIKVLREDSKFVGFVAYYMKNFFLGQLLFVGVNPDFRGKGYAQKLMQYAIDDMKKQGASMISLVTRTSNLAAQAVYKKLGFSVTHEEDGFVYFELRV